MYDNVVLKINDVLKHINFKHVLNSQQYHVTNPDRKVKSRHHVYTYIYIQ